MKKDLLLPAAERMFVIELATIDTIANELHIAEKTVRIWKKAGGWDSKRVKHLKVKTDFHSELYVLARKIMGLLELEVDRLVANDGESGEDQDSKIESRINSLSRLLDKLPKTKDYETTIKNEKLEDNKGKKITGAMIAEEARKILNG